MTLPAAQRTAILSTLYKNDGHRANTAKDLAISVRKLRYMINEYRQAGWFIP